MTCDDSTIKYGLLCEDVRREDNGKLMALGIYGRSVELGSIPGRLVLAPLIALESPSEGVADFEALILLDDDQLGKAEGQINFDGKGIAHLSLPQMGFPISKEGQLIFKARLDKGNWIELWRGPLNKRT